MCILDLLNHCIISKSQRQPRNDFYNLIFMELTRVMITYKQLFKHCVNGTLLTIYMSFYKSLITENLKRPI